MHAHAARVMQNCMHVALQITLQDSARHTEVNMLILAVLLTAVKAAEIPNTRRSLLDNFLERSCPSVPVPHHSDVTCLFNGSPIYCSGKPAAGTVAVFHCDQYYVLDDNSTVECLPNGTWSGTVPRCVPDCGKANIAVTLIVHGNIATPGVFPWQAALYNFLDDKWEFWCGGSLVSEHMVITAAHCTYKVPPENLMMAFGKFFRDFDADEDHVQKIKVDRVEMLQSYQDVGGNYNGDLAVVFLERGVELSPVVKPICIDWNQERMETQLLEGTNGAVLGWGLTENDTFSDMLRSLYLPVMSDDTCISQQQRDFKKFVTYTSFCAGFRNGTGVCNGDSGGGLAFVDAVTDRWYLQGVVSVSPRRRGTAFCDPNFYTVFTKVSVFVKWLAKMKQLEEELLASHVKLSAQGSSEVVDMNPKINVMLRKQMEEEEKEQECEKRNSSQQHQRTILFPLTDKILASAGIN